MVTTAVMLNIVASALPRPTNACVPARRFVVVVIVGMWALPKWRQTSVPPLQKINLRAVLAAPAHPEREGQRTIQVRRIGRGSAV